MKYWKMRVKQFGKIREATIELAPMTLFVGDNNSGKSYLLSLVWAIRTIIKDFVFDGRILKNIQSDSYQKLKEIFIEKMQMLQTTDGQTINISAIKTYLQDIINELLIANKDQFVKALFNSDTVQIEELSLEMPDDLDGEIEICIEDDKVEFSYYDINAFIGRDFFANQDRVERLNFVVDAYVMYLITRLLDVQDDLHENVYLPAARTGFMLTKDIINSYARKKTFDLEVNSTKQEQPQPFSRPIIEFLNVINDLSEEQCGKKNYEGLIRFIQNEMVQGNVEIGALAGKELSYLPNGKEQRYPFRTTSAVVTELSPLLLLLEHRANLNALFYEEPEMCLHPALQKKMGQLLVKLVNTGVDITATTHSDIILQHINNMIQLQNQGNSRWAYDDSDAISKDQVRVYQFTNLKDETSDVIELECGDNGFVVQTFNDALDKIFEETIQIQG